QKLVLTGEWAGVAIPSYQAPALADIERARPESLARRQYDRVNAAIQQYAVVVWLAGVDHLQFVSIQPSHEKRHDPTGQQHASSGNVASPTHMSGYSRGHPKYPGIHQWHQGPNSLTHKLAMQLR